MMQHFMYNFTSKIVKIITPVEYFIFIFECHFVHFKCFSTLATSNILAGDDMVPAEGSTAERHHRATS